MQATKKPFHALTAHDLMTRAVLTVPQNMPLPDAGRLLLQHQVHGAPVVDAEGKCVGLLSSTDYMRSFDRSRATTTALPVTCSFQREYAAAGSKPRTLCTLPRGACAVQVQQTANDGSVLVVCSLPDCVLADWQIVELEKLPAEAVSRFMTADPVLVAGNTPIARLARLMVGSHARQVVVVEEGQKPVGIVSATDVLAATATLN